MKKSNFTIKAIIILMIIFAVVFIVTGFSKTYIDYKYTTIEKPNIIAFDVEKIEKYIFQGKTVVVRFTSEKCVKCRIMDVFLFSDTEVVEFLEENDIIYMVADTLSKDQEMIDFMKDNKIEHLPAVYVANQDNPSGKINMGILSKDKFIEFIKSSVAN